MSTDNILATGEDITAEINNIKTPAKTKKNKDKKPNKWLKWVIIGGIAALIVIYIAISSAIAKSAPPIVMVANPEKGTVKQTIDLSGTVKSLDKKTYFSLVDGTVAEVNFMVGDSVKKGDVLFKYDEEKLEKSVTLAELKKDAAEGSYNNSIQSNNKTGSKLSEALTNLSILDEQVEFAQNYVDDLQKKIDDKKASLSYEGAMLQVSLLDYYPGSEEYTELQKRIQENSYEQQYNSQVREMQDELTEATRILNDLKTHQTEMKSQKTGAQDTAMTSGAKAELEANHESTVIELEENLENLGEVQGGVTADFDGVITQLNVNEGGLVAKNADVLTIESLENVVVEAYVTKIDLENISMGQKATITVNGKTYEGEISHINKMAEKNQSGSTVVATQIKILNPDDGLVLGLEAKASVLVGEKNDVIRVSNDKINYDVDGAFVYVVNEGTVEKRRIEVGLVNDMDSEIVSGIGTEDQILTIKPDDVEEGMAVTAVPE
ncbi:MAG: HlyD family efflux transporter periplasmic adaptor subunit [Lachnospiraceae bacterium]|nr:HlyD family efflux transporter periplasmic adaptor subunit [Lachnospiraceae bacterium]